jgi:hypothetical protein
MRVEARIPNLSFSAEDMTVMNKGNKKCQTHFWLKKSMRIYRLDTSLSGMNILALQ